VIIGFAWYLRRSVWGYELRIAGSSEKAAAYAGISVRRKVLGVLLVSGAVAGFAGGIELLTTTTGKLTVQISNGYGFAGIIVAALALMRPSGVAAVALAFGALQVGGQAIQTNPGVSPAVATILQGLVLFGAIGAAVFSTYRLRLVDRQVAES
jgi:simple sugar transport system permease protein